MNKKKLEIIRKKIDNVDKKLLEVIVNRTNLVKKIILIKSNKKQIVDKKRIKKVLLNIKKHSIKKEIDTKITANIWKSMIKSYIDFEKKHLKKNK